MYPDVLVPPCTTPTLHARWSAHGLYNATRDARGNATVHFAGRPDVVLPAAADIPELTARWGHAWAPWSITWRPAEARPNGWLEFHTGIPAGDGQSLVGYFPLNWSVPQRVDAARFLLRETTAEGDVAIEAAANAWVGTNSTPAFTDLEKGIADYVRPSTHFTPRLDAWYRSKASWPNEPTAPLFLVPEWTLDSGDWRLSVSAHRADGDAAWPTGQFQIRALPDDRADVVVRGEMERDAAESLLFSILGRDRIPAPAQQDLEWSARVCHA